MIGVSLMTLKRWEWGNTEPRAEELQKLATALDTTSAYLLGESDDPRPIKSADKAEPLRADINFEPVNKDDTARETSIDIYIWR
ncbi:MAG: helix-turn-helix domain-containing protein [Synergistaceae bacterium]|nr:helix-turn-helix domain-containing protein [Synergistaceae bacterium]